MPVFRKLIQPRLTNRLRFTFLLIAMLVVISFYLGGSFQGRKSLMINEIMTSNRSTISDEDGDYPDWFEIYNPGKHPVSIDGYWVTNDPQEPFMWQFPEVIIEPGGYQVIFASAKDRSDPEGDSLHTNFRLSASGSSLLLIDPDTTVIDSVTTPAMLSNVSYGRKINKTRQWTFYLDATPGAANDVTPYDQVIPMPRADEKLVLINEFLTDNRTSIPDEDGDLSDWIELYNPGNSPVDLNNYWISDKSDNPFKWRFPAITINPGQYLLVFASGKNRQDPKGSYLHTNFRLNDRDDTLILSKPEGIIVDEVVIRNMERDVSYGRDRNDPERWLYFPRPTPGEENYSQGFDKFSGTPVPNLIISEVMSVNISTIADEDGDFSGWIEIYNPDHYAVNLKGYGLSDKEENPYRWEFPETIIKPGEYLLLFASGKDRREPEEGFLHTNFKIKATGETLVLYHPSGTMIDNLPSGMLSPDISSGRLPDGGNERYFFEEPTPGKTNNSTTLSGYTLPPTISHQGGFYDKHISLEINTPSTRSIIRYTLDGSEPDENSNLYTNPLFLEQTAVLRTRTFEEGRLPSPVENRTYLIGEEHNLTVISIMMDPRDLWDPVEGIYVKGSNAIDRFPYYGANFWKDMEKPIHLELYETDGTLGLSFNAGIKIGGQFSRAMDQKIFNVFARNIYGYNEIRYPMFPRKDLTSFKALTLRTGGQDATFSKIRDIMMTSLLENTGLDYQDHRQAVLYLNGEYWGIYNVRERANHHFIAANNNLDPYNIDLLQANWLVRAGSNEHYLDLLNFVRSNDLSKQDNYDYIQTQMDVTNYIDALIAQIYYAQTDQGNIRYWREQSEEGKWRWLVFDFDWGFWPNHLNNNTLADMTHPAGTGAWRNISTTLPVNLLKNPDFRDQFIERFAYHLNHTFQPNRVIDRIEELASNIEPEVPRHFDRWADPSGTWYRGGSVERWYKEIEAMKEFARLRPMIVMEHIQTKFQLSSEEMTIFNGWQKH